MFSPTRIDSKLSLPAEKPAQSRQTDPRIRAAAVKHIREELKKQKAALPNTELVVVTAVGSGKALYDVVTWNGGTTSDAFNVTDDHIGPLAVGSTAIMRRYPNGEPYLKGPGATALTLPDNEDDPLEPISPDTGQWLNTSGYWYNSWSSRNPMRPMEDRIENSETFTPASTGLWIYEDDNDVLKVVLTIPDTATIDSSEALFDGSPRSGAFYTSLDGYKVIGWFSVTSEPTLVEVTYRYSLLDSALIGGGNPQNDGPMSLRGVVMFPAGIAQMAAVLTQTYVDAEGTELTTQHAAYSDESPNYDVWAIPLNFAPVIANSVYLPNTYVDDYRDNPSFNVVFMLANDSLYMLSQMSDGISFTYALSAGPATSELETFVVGAQSVQQKWKGTDVFNLKTHPRATWWTSYTLVTCYNLNLSSSPVSFSQVGDEVTIDSTGFTMDDELLFECTFEWDIVYKVYANRPVTGINSIDSPVGPDAGASFYGYEITLSLGSELHGHETEYVNVDYEGYSLISVHGATYSFGGPDFFLGDVPIPGSIEINYDEYTPVDYPPDWPIRAVLSLDPNDPDPETDGQCRVYFALNIPASSPYHAEYDYLGYEGGLLNFTTGLIREFNVTAPDGATNLSFPTSGSATPQTKFEPLIGTPLGQYWRIGWDYLLWGYLHYNPNRGGYIAVLSDGVHWKTRQGGSGSHVFLPWPVEGLSLDPTYRGGWDYPEGPGGSWPAGTADDVIPGLKRRTAPEFGVSVVSRYVLQGSFGPVGSTSTFKLAPRSSGGGTGGNPCDLSFPIRGIKLNRNLTAWEVVGELSPLALVQDRAGTNPVYLPGCGIIHREGRSGWSYGHGPNLGGIPAPKNTWWPMSKDCKSWIVGVGWCESEWYQNNGDKVNGDPEDYEAYPRGHSDSGFTLNAIDPVTFQVTSQLTIKCDPDYREGIFSDDGDYGFAAQDEIDHAPNYFATTTFDLHETRAAETFWGYYPGYGLCFFFYVLDSLDVPSGRSPLLRYPGIPSLADGPPRYANLDVVTSIGPEDAYQSQEITLADDGDLYFCLSMPFWYRIDDETVIRRSEEVTGTWVCDITPFDATPYIAGYIGPSSTGRYTSYLGNSRGFYMTGWMGGNIITDVTGPATVAFSDYGGTSLVFHPWAGFFSPFADVANHVGAFFPIQDDLSNPIIGTDYASIEYVIGYNGKPNTCVSLEIPWRQTIPHQTYTHFQLYHDRFESGITYTASTLGPGTSLGPWQGVIMFGVQGLQRRRYLQNARTFLFRVSCVDGVLTEKWRKDVSFKGQIGPNFSATSWGTAAPVTRTDNSKFGRVYCTRPKGRVIFLVRSKPVLFSSKVVLEIYDNSNPEVEPTLLHELDLIATREVDHVDLMEGITDGLEWAEFSAKFSEGLFTTRSIKALVKMKENLSDDPDLNLIQLDNIDLPESVQPQEHQFRGTAQASNTFVWTTRDGSVYKRST